MYKRLMMVTMLAVWANTAATAETAFWVRHVERDSTILTFQRRLTNGEPMMGAFDVLEFSRLGIPLAQSERIASIIFSRVSGRATVTKAYGTGSMRISSVVS